MLQDAGLIEENLSRHCGARWKMVIRQRSNLLSQPDRPTALLVINDLLAMAVLRAAADLGLQVPRDVSIAGFDDIPLTNLSFHV